MAEYAINLLGNVCELLVIHFFYSAYEKKFSKGVTVGLSILFTAFQFTSNNLFLGKSTLVMLGVALFAFFVSLLYEVKWLNRLLYSVFFLLVIALPELFMAMALSLLFDIDISFMQGSPVLFAAGTLISKFLSYVFVLITKKRRFRFNGIISKRNLLWIYLLPLASVLILVLFLRCCYTIEDLGFRIIMLISAVVLMFANIAIFHIIDKLNEHLETKERLLFAEKHISNQVVHYQELYKYQNELRIFRHDIRNRLLSLIGLLKENETEKALHTMENSLDWLNSEANAIVNSGNPVVDAIVQSKLHTAKQKGIVIDENIKLSESIKIDEIELGIILGNALDNAIEAVERLPDGENKHIDLRLITVGDRISVSIQNPVAGSVDTESLTTSKTDRNKHGYGIKSIKTIAQKYDGMAAFTCESNVFAVKINLRNRPCR